VTFFADLGDLHQSIFPQFQASAHRKFPELDTFGGNIFGKIAWIDIETLLTNLRDAFNGQKADLAMPITGMGVIFKTVISRMFVFLTPFLVLMETATIRPSQVCSRSVIFLPTF